MRRSLQVIEGEHGVQRRYRYVGPAEIARAVAGVPPGERLGAPDETRNWLDLNRDAFDRAGRLTVTFVVDDQGVLRVADRHSEHVACAGGAPVLAAGEMTFRLAGRSISAVEVTNQSTGYCPEPESWAAVAEALNKAGIAGPAAYTTAFIFRRCEHCGQVNLVKDAVFDCDVCGSALPARWNVDVSAG